MPGKILIAEADPASSNWIATKLEREGFVVITVDRGELVPQAIARGHPDLLVIEPSLPDTNGLDLIQRLRQNPNNEKLRIVILSAKIRPEDIVAGLRAGADDYIPKRPGADTELIAKIGWLLAPSTAARRGHIISFCSAKGGTGTTTVCVNTAYALAKLEPQAEVLVVDMVFPLGTIGQSVGYESPETIARFTREVEGTIDHAVLAKYISPKERWGFRVMLGAGDLQEANNLDVTRILPLFETLQTIYDYILVDFGRALSRISLPVIEISKSIVVVLTPDINTVKLTHFMLQSFESRGIPKERLILLNNRTVGRVWISKEEIESALKLESPLTIPHESEHMTMAVNQGIPFMAKFPENIASWAFTDFAKLLTARIKSKPV